MSEYIVDFGVIAFVDTKSGKVTVNQNIVGELIRCRDCKFYYPEFSGCEKPFGVFFDAHDSDFCSYAEPREAKK